MIHPGRTFSSRRVEPPPWYRRLLERAPECRRLVQSSFSGVCRSVIDESCQETLLHVWANRARWERVWHEHGEERLVRWFRLALWRRVRGWWRDHGRRAADVGPAGLAERVGMVSPAQDALLRVRRDLPGAVDRAARTAGGGDAAAVRAALWDGLATDAPDTELALRHGLRREYVNRARNALWREVWE